MHFKQFVSSLTMQKKNTHTHIQYEREKKRSNFIDINKIYFEEKKILSFYKVQDILWDKIGEKKSFRK